MAKYKPGQLFTYRGKIFRVKKRRKYLCLHICSECNVMSVKNGIFDGRLCCIDGYRTITSIKTCVDLLVEDYLYPQYIKDNPLCVKN